MAEIHQHTCHESGIPLGGIGTGSVEIRPDGLFHEWHMFNIGQWNPRAPCKCSDGPAMGPDDCVFVVRTRTGRDEIIVRYLALAPSLHDLYNLAWVRAVEAITFDGRFPAATLTYHDSDLPVEITAEVFSPFVPLNARTSGTPGFYVHFTAANLTQSPVEVSIMAVMKNAVGFGQDGSAPVNRLIESLLHGAKAIMFSADGLSPGECSTGDMTLVAAGGEISHITGSYDAERRVISFPDGHDCARGYKPVSMLHFLRDDGRLPDTNCERKPALPSDFDAAKLSAKERSKVLADMMKIPFVHELARVYSRVDPEIVGSPQFLNETASRLWDLERRGMAWGWGALCSRSEVQPEGQSEALFAMSWFFPNHISPTGENIGHMYEHWFDGSLGVAEFLLDNFADIRDRVFAMPDAIHNCSLPEEAADAVTGQLSTMTKCTWWTRAGHFGVWEGYGCCGFHTTDITYQGSFPIISLFPELQKAQMERGAQFQREDGRVHHFFTPDFSAVDNGFDRVDMNPQFVMLACRDHLWTGDREYLERLWPHILRAMRNSALLDTDGDGLPDHDTRRNTYDAWDFSGCPSYISSLWLGALKAAARLADEMGDVEQAREWRDTYARGLKSFDKRLWNGRYYVLWRDGDDTDECCMSDQMSADWFSEASGWGGILKPHRVRRALNAIMEFNFREGAGLVNASYPPGAKRRIAASGNVQADAPWTGIEYTVASLLIAHGMVSEGMSVVRDIHDRYMRAGRFWDHVECGNHYYRAMSSWTVLLTMSGFAWDKPAGGLSFAPAVDEPECEYPFFTPDGWGVYSQQAGLVGRAVQIAMEDGELFVRRLRLPRMIGLQNAVVTVGGEHAKCRIDSRRGTVITFPRPIAIKPSQGLLVQA